MIASYPKWSKVEELPVDEDEGDCDSGFVQFAYSYFLQVVGDLWERGILMTNEPLEAHYDDP